MSGEIIPPIPTRLSNGAVFVKPKILLMEIPDVTKWHHQLYVIHYAVYNIYFKSVIVKTLENENVNELF